MVSPPASVMVMIKGWSRYGASAEVWGMFGQLFEGGWEAGRCCERR